MVTDLQVQQPTAAKTPSDLLTLLGALHADVSRAKRLDSIEDLARWVIEVPALKRLLRPAPLHAVTAVLRANMSRGERVGHPVRGERSFKVLLDTPSGERELVADAVLDASGSTTPIVTGARGERSVPMIRSFGECHERRSTFADRRILLVGHGHSAANALHLLAGIAGEAAGTRIVWAVRTLDLRPCVEVASDPLPERNRIVAGANALAARPPSWLTIERRAAIEAIERALGAYRVTLTGGRVIEVDQVISLTGTRHRSEQAAATQQAK